MDNPTTPHVHHLRRARPSTLLHRRRKIEAKTATPLVAAHSDDDGHDHAYDHAGEASAAWREYLPDKQLLQQKLKEWIDEIDHHGPSTLVR
ncbi:MAG: hypothetical protein ACKVUS_19535 [Saprospiraceae bacterium]